MYDRDDSCEDECFTDEGECFDDSGEEYMMADRYADLTMPGLYDREPDEPGMDYGPDDWD